jgi:uncharacterized protein with HEPN domain
MSADDLERLRHMLAAAREAISFIEGKSAEDLIHNRLLLLAVVKEIEIVGEAASRISPEGRQAAPVIPWGKVTGMRNRLTHGYFNWDLEVIWSTLVTSLPVLVSELEEAIRQAANE